MTKANCIRVLNVDHHRLLRKAGDRRDSSSRVLAHVFSFGITAAIRRCDTAAANNRGERLLLKIRISRIRRDSK